MKKLDAHGIYRQPDDSFEVVAEVHKLITTNPLSSTKSVARNLDIPKTTVLKIIRCVLRMFPYRLHPRPSVSIWIRSTAFDFENYFFNRYNEVNKWLATNILWRDEGRISIIENANFKNCVHWVDECRTKIIAQS